jgi:hypothetical protein
MLTRCAHNAVLIKSPPAFGLRVVAHPLHLASFFLLVFHFCCATRIAVCIQDITRLYLWVVPCACRWLNSTRSAELSHEVNPTESHATACDQLLHPPTSTPIRTHNLCIVVPLLFFSFAFRLLHSGDWDEPSDCASGRACSAWAWKC